jgi:hypothetical protein
MTTKDDRLLDYLYGEMNAEERQAFEAAARHPQLQKELEALRRVQSTLRSLPEESPSATASQNILRQARLHADQRQHRQGYWASLWKPLTMIGATAAAALALIVSMRTYETHDPPPEPPPSIPERQPEPSTPLAEKAEPLPTAPAELQPQARPRRLQKKQRVVQSPPRQMEQRSAAAPFAEQEALAPADSVQVGAAAAASSARDEAATAPKASRSIQSHPANSLESGLLLLRDGKCLAAFPLLERAVAANAQASAHIASELAPCRDALLKHRTRYPNLNRLLPPE